MHLINPENNSYVSVAIALFTLAIIAAASMGSAPAAATTAATTTMPQPVTATTDNQSVNVLVSWEPMEIEPGQDTEFTLDFQDPSSGDSISHVNYNFEIVDQNNGETVQSMTDLHTHSGTDEQTVAFDTAGSFNLVATIIGTGINPPFDITQSGTAQTVIPVGQAVAGSMGGNNTAGTTDNITASTEAATPTTETTTTPVSPSEIELSPAPVYQEQIRNTGQTPINQTHIQITYSGNGTLNLPNSTETIRTTSSASGIASMIDNDFAGKEVLTTEDGSETATATVYGLLRFDMQEGNGRGITIATVHTNSTDMLAPLDGMILTGINELYPDGTGSVTLWEWQSGIPLPNTTTPEEPPLTDTTTTTNATTTTTTTTTTADTGEPTAALPEEGGEGEGEEQQQQQTTPTAPPNPLFE